MFDRLCDTCPVVGKLYFKEMCKRYGPCWIKNGNGSLTDILRFSGIDLFDFLNRMNPRSYMYQVDSVGNFCELELYGPIEPMVGTILMMADIEDERRRNERLESFGFQEGIRCIEK